MAWSVLTAIAITCMKRRFTAPWYGPRVAPRKYPDRHKIEGGSLYRLRPDATFPKRACMRASGHLFEVAKGHHLAHTEGRNASVARTANGPSGRARERFPSASRGQGLQHCSCPLECSGRL